MSAPFPPLSTPELLVYSSLLAIAIYLILTLFSRTGRSNELTHTTLVLPAPEDKARFDPTPALPVSTSFYSSPDSRSCSASYASPARFSSGNIPPEKRVVAAVQKAIKAGDATAFRSSIEYEFRTDWDELDGRVLHRITLPRGRSVLHDAAFNGALKIVKTICDRAPFLMCKPDESGETVWHIAARDEYVSKGLFDTLYDTRQLWKKRLEAADTLTVSANGVNGSMRMLSIHAANIKDGNTALHEALLCKNTPVAQKLFEADKDVCYKLNMENKSPIHLALENGEGDAALFLSMFEYAVGTALGKSAIDALWSSLVESAKGPDRVCFTHIETESKTKAKY